MPMVTAGMVQATHALQVLLQRGEGALGATNIAGLEGALERLQILAELTGLSWRAVRRVLSVLGSVRPVLLQRSKCLLCCREIPGIERGLKGFEVLRALLKCALDLRLVRGHS